MSNNERNCDMSSADLTSAKGINLQHFTTTAANIENRDVNTWVFFFKHLIH